MLAFMATAHDALAEPLDRIFLNMGGLDRGFVRDTEANRQATSGTPQYPSNTPSETTVFEGVFVPTSSTSKLAIFSDDGCTVEINCVEVPGCIRAVFLLFLSRSRTGFFVKEIVVITHVSVSPVVVVPVPARGAAGLRGHDNIALLAPGCQPVI